MSLHNDLLEQAWHLARRERRRPRQASLRRAVSTAYYSLFHLLIREASTLLVSVPGVRPRFARAFDHAEMRNASRAFGSPQPQQLASLTGGAMVPTQVQSVARAFVHLQELRHEADYDAERVFTRAEVIDLVSVAEQAHLDWQTVREDAGARVYLSAMLLWKRWSRF